MTGKALGCPELYEKDLQLISTYSPNGQALNGEPLGRLRRWLNLRG